MKKALLFFSVCAFFILSYFGRYTPVSLDLVSPTTKQCEIKGEVEHPGVYTLKWEGTIKDLITQAGGLTDQAETSSISLAKEINDKEVVVIPKKNVSQKQKISLNSASLEQLDELPGIGPSIANRIIEYRNQKSLRRLKKSWKSKALVHRFLRRLRNR